MRYFRKYGKLDQDFQEALFMTALAVHGFRREHYHDHVRLKVISYRTDTETNMYSMIYSVEEL